MNLGKKELVSGIDLIICWPNSMDYPVWRAFILKHQELFGKIFIVFTNTNAGIDYSHFVQEALKGDRFEFLYPEDPRGDEDWRDNAINLALDQSTANWIWFTEQDLLVTGPQFWQIIALSMTKYDVIGYKEGQRLHPANLWVKREFINKTPRFFGIVPDQLDHFGKFFFSLRHTGADMQILKYTGGEAATDIFYHMNGLSHNLSLIQRGERPVYKEDEFANYLMLSLQVEPLDPRYKEMAEAYLKEYQGDENTD